MLEDEDCYQSPLQPYSLPWNDLSWSLGNTSIATGDAGNEEITGQSEGWTTFSADYDDSYWEAQPDGEFWYCADEPLELDFDANIEVACFRPKNLARETKENMDKGQFKVQFRWDTDPDWLAVGMCEIGEHLTYNTWPNPPFNSARLPSKYPSGGYQSFGAAGRQDPREWDLHTTGGNPWGPLPGWRQPSRITSFAALVRGPTRRDLGQPTLGLRFRVRTRAPIR